jgi:electron transport complex protein RnfC
MADAAKARFELRNERDEREKAEKAERLARAAAAKAAAKKAPAESGSELQTGDMSVAAVAAAPLDAEAVKKAAIAAAMERARQQRESVQPKNTEGLTVAQRKEIAEIEARRLPLQEQSALNAENAEAQSSQREKQ